MQYFIWRIIRNCSKKVAAAAAGQRAPVRRGMVIGPQANHTALPGRAVAATLRCRPSTCGRVWRLERIKSDKLFIRGLMSMDVWSGREPASPVLGPPPRFRGFRFACAESAPPHNRTFSLKWTLPPSWRKLPRNSVSFVVVSMPSGTALDARVSSAGSKRAEGCSIVFEFCNTAMNADAAKPAADFSSDAVAKAGYANNYNGSTPSRYDPVNPTYRTGPTLDMGGRPLIGGGSHLNYYKK